MGGKTPQKRMECFRLPMDRPVWADHWLLSGIQDSRKVESVRDNGRCGRYREVRTPELARQIRNFMDEDRRVSIDTISTQFDVNMGTVHTIIHEKLKMRKICAKFFCFLWVLGDDQEERRHNGSRELSELIDSDPEVLEPPVTCDES